MRVEMSVEGLDGVLKTLQGLPPELVSKRGGPVARALAKAARVIRDEEIKNLNAIVGDQSTGLLAKNIVASRGKAPTGTKGERYLVRVRRKAYDGEKIGKRQKAGKRVTTYKTANLLEYGSSHQPARPWIRPAVQAKGQEAINVFTKEIHRQIDLTVKKLARQNQ